jgi:hypothetical protein
MSIRMHIEELVVEGIALNAIGARDFERAVQTRLAELLTQPLDADNAASSTITLPSHIDAATLGTSVAESVHATLPCIEPGESP